MDQKKSVFNWQLFLGLVLVLAGGIFLADQFLPAINLIRRFWPLLIVLLGLMFFVGMLFSGRSGSGLAIPGSVLTTLGLLLFIQNRFHLWVTWTYAWALLICSVGLGLLIMNIYIKRSNLRRAAGLLIGIGLTLFVIFDIFFEIILSISGAGRFNGIFLGAGLVLLGLFVVFSRLLFSRSVRPEAGPLPSTDGVMVEGEAIEAKGETEEVETGEVAETGEVLVAGEEFTYLTFNSVGEMFLTQSDSCSLAIKGAPELTKKIKTKVVGDELSVTFDAKIIDWSDLQFLGSPTLQYFISMKSIEGLKIGGAGNLVADRIEAEKLSIVHSGLGKLQINDLHCQDLSVELGGLGEVKLKGTVQNQAVDLTGAGGYEAEELESQTAKVTLSGAGSAKVWAEATLDADVSGAGSIRYKGKATVTQTTSGAGRVNTF